MELFDKAIKRTYIMYQGANTRKVASIWTLKNKKLSKISKVPSH